MAPSLGMRRVCAFRRVSKRENATSSTSPVRAATRALSMRVKAPKGRSARGFSVRAVAAPMQPDTVDERIGEERKPRKVAIFVEPSPFSHVSGMRNRFLGLIDSLHEEGDEVCLTLFFARPMVA